MPLTPIGSMSSLNIFVKRKGMSSGKGRSILAPKLYPKSIRITVAVGR